MLQEIVARVLVALGTMPLGSGETAPREHGEVRLQEERRGTMRHCDNPSALRELCQKTPARIGIGKTGPRLMTVSLLQLRADHAAARDAVWKTVDPQLLESLELECLQTCCTDTNMHLTRPDQGRRFPEETLQKLRSLNPTPPTVQVYLSDGLSSAAVEANARDILPALLDGLEDRHITAGKPFFVRFGRVPAMDVVSEQTGAELTCVLLGERPGLATANSMSAYIAYRAVVGMPEARRTVVSNIHSGGIPAAEAGAHIADLIAVMLREKASGVELRL